MKLISPLPPPSVFLSAKQWFVAGFYTVLYKLPELTHLFAFTVVRHFRKSRVSNERLLHLERHFLTRAESYHHRWGHAFCSSFGINVQVESRIKMDVSSNEHVLLVLLNQESILLGPAVAVISGDLSKCKKCRINERFLPTYFVFQNIEFTLLPFFGSNSGLTGVVIRRGNKQSKRAGLQRLIQQMNTFNDTFTISIEGQRNKDGHLNTYRMGAAIIAIQTKSDIIPMTFENMGQLWPYGQWRIRSGQIKIILHDRISTKNLTLNDKEILTQKLRNIAEIEFKRTKTIDRLEQSACG